MNDPYLYENSSVLRNLLNIRDEKELDLAESELSRANMMLLYEKGFQDFSTLGIKKIHKVLFGDVYDWAGQFRKINIRKSEPILVGKSVWYSNDEDIERDLELAWEKIQRITWGKLPPIGFAEQVARTFPALWQTHPFREGNTRTVVMMMTFFVEHYGYTFDQELMAASAGYVRQAFVLASQFENSEYEHLEKILKDAIRAEPIIYEDDLDQDAQHVKNVNHNKTEKYRKYHIEDYQPVPHEVLENRS